jgi:ATP-dependent Clp protease adaptor protein ClpS
MTELTKATKDSKISPTVANNPAWQEQTEVLVEVLEDQERNLMVYNDDFNTFDHVIDTLVKICGHTTIQAEQCAHIIHYKGKCSVKHGTYDDLKPMRDGIREAGIDARIL